MKKLTRTLCLLLTVCLFLPLVSCEKLKKTKAPESPAVSQETQTPAQSDPPTGSPSEDDPNRITALRLSKTGVTLKVGASERIIGTTVPATADKTGLVWSVQDAEIAKVEGGLITGLAPGSTRVFLKTADGLLKATCEVVVTSGDDGPTVIPVNDIVLGSRFLIVTAGDTGSIAALAKPDNATDKTMTYTVGDAAVASVAADGKVTGISSGVTAVTVRAGSVSRDCILVVLTPEGNLPAGARANVTVEANKTLDLFATDTICNGLTGLNCTSSNDDIVTVNNGVITGIAQGSATVTLMNSQSKKFFSFDVTVTKPTGPVDPPIDPSALVKGVIILEETPITVKVGKTAKVTAELEPKGATGAKIYWISENKAAFSVDSNGQILGLAPGTGYVTAYVRAQDGHEYTDILQVTVIPAD